MKTALVFARMDSRRLPGKPLVDIAGKAMLDRVVARVAAARAVGQVVVATSDRPIDDPVADRAEALGVDVFRGAGEDVAGRALACCAARGLDAFVRISGDSPFVAPEVIDAVCALFDEVSPDLATNVHPRTFPPGCSAEAIGAGALGRAAERMGPADREHVTAFLYRHAEEFHIANLESGRDFGNVRLTVDTEAELMQARWIAGRAGSGPDRRGLDEIAALARAFRDDRRAAAP